MIELSEKTCGLLDALFPGHDRNEAAELLRLECGDNIPFCEDRGPVEMERIRFAVLKLSEGNIDKLVRAIELAQVDWRDLFMAAGFAEDVEAHIHWSGRQLEQHQPRT